MVVKNERAYIFDFDGTLLDSEPLWAEALNLALREQDIELTAQELVTLVYGRSRADIITDLVRDYPRLGNLVEHLEERIDHHLEALEKGADIRKEEPIS